MKKKYILLIITIGMSLSAFSQRFNTFIGINMFEFRKLSFYQEQYSDPNYAYDLKIKDQKQWQLNTSLVSSAALGLSYEYNGFILATGLGFYSSEQKVSIAVWNGSDYENSEVSYDIPGLYVPVYLYYSFWTLNSKRSFASVGLRFKYNFNEKEIPKKEFSEMRYSEYYEYALMDATYYRHATFVSFRLGREKIKEGQTYSYGIEAELPLRSNDYYSEISFSLFLEYRLAFAKKKKYSNIYINQRD